jgi:hypothetical protein
MNPHQLLEHRLQVYQRAVALGAGASYRVWRWRKLNQAIAELRVAQAAVVAPSEPAPRPAKAARMWRQARAQWEAASR